MSTKQLNQRQVRWAEFLSQFNFIITYRAGTKATFPDTLSKLSRNKPTDTQDERLRYRHQTILPQDKIDPIILEELLGDAHSNGNTELVTALEFEPRDKTLDTLIREAYTQDDLTQAIMAAIREKTRRWPKKVRKQLRCDKAECSVIDSMIYYRNRLFIPNTSELKLEITHRTHSIGAGEHSGRVKTLDLLNRIYWWPRIS